MNQDKFGQLIKKIRKENNLTQKDLADKYHVSYQAVSKWERGQNLPDISLMKQISEDYSISLDNMIEGNYSKNKKNYLIIIAIITLLILIVCLLLFKKDSFYLKELKTSCDNFKISGVISYNETKSAIYIPKIEYCGNDGEKIYNKIECILYEKGHDISKIISSYKIEEEKSLDEFLKSVNFKIDNYISSCKSYHVNLFFL